MITIYIDLYFFINFIVDYFALTIVEKLTLIKKSTFRKILASFLASLFSLLVLFLPKAPFISPLLNISFAFITVSILIFERKFIKLFSGVLVFIAGEVFIGGCVVALKNLFSSIDKGEGRLAGVILLTGVFGSYFFEIYQKLCARRLREIPLFAKIFKEGKTAEVTLMVDSGNLARENISKRRLLFVEEEKVKHLCNEENSFIPIPIRTASGEALVWGFVPDKIEFSKKNYNRESFILVPDTNKLKFGGYDGIAPLI